MNQQELFQKNELARRQFSQNCHGLRTKIRLLQENNERLSQKLDILIGKQTLLIHRMRELLDG